MVSPLLASVPPLQGRMLEDPGVICLSYMSEVLWYLGHPDQAVQRSQGAPPATWRTHSAWRSP